MMPPNGNATLIDVDEDGDNTESAEGKHVNPPLNQVLRTVGFKHVRKNDERVF